MRSQIRKLSWKFQETFGYITKFKREQVLGLEKTHYNDSVATCCNENNLNIQLSDVVYYKKHVSKGDYQQTKGSRFENEMVRERVTYQIGMNPLDLGIEK
ncbi:hypothetical protein [Methanohalobium sp.]|uniref:hypothetical protein n=1 Tax=Methanohalobium sp. TaxID=2837493 RepID=UPI0025FC971D|nr:hypothetical protein [Methanohalobium sp.]